MQFALDLPNLICALSANVRYWLFQWCFGGRFQLKAAICLVALHEAANAPEQTLVTYVRCRNICISFEQQYIPMT
jgi:hypothetical protein